MTRAPTAAGTQRRLQALMARSWSLQTLARTAGLRAPKLARALENPATITPEFASEVRAAYDQLWNREPPRQTQTERELAEAASQTARLRGWAPPLAWDDEQIDNPKAEPSAGWQRSGRKTLRSPDLLEDAEFVRSSGGYQKASVGDVAQRLGVTRAQLEKAISRQRSPRSGGRELEAG